MSAALQALVQEAQATGTLAGLPDKHLIGGQWRASVTGAQMQTFDPGTGKPFTVFAAVMRRTSIWHWLQPAPPGRGRGKTRHLRNAARCWPGSRS
jgi:hypothetical protein